MKNQYILLSTKTPLKDFKEKIYRLGGVWNCIGYAFPPSSEKEVKEIFGNIPSIKISSVPLKNPWEIFKIETKLTIVRNLLENDPENVKLKKKEIELCAKLEGLKALYEKNTVIQKHEEEEKIVEHLNQEWAFIDSSGLMAHTKNFSINFIKKGQFFDIFANQILADGKKTHAGLWFRHPERRSYRSVDFRADKTAYEFIDENGDKHLNLWKGLQCQATDDHHDLIIEHFKEILCNGKEDVYEFLILILANWVQKPWEKTVCPVFRSREGTGKKIMPILMQKFFGDAFLSESKKDLVMGNFNEILSGKLVVQLSEAFFGGDKNLAGTLKDLITEDIHTINPKNQKPFIVQNQKKFFIVSNEEFAIPVSEDGRRFFFLDVSESKIRDTEYFSRLYSQLSNGGAEGFLKYLLNIDIPEKFNPQILPDCALKSGFTNKIRSACSFKQFLYEFLNEESIDLYGELSQNDSYWKDDGFEVIKVFSSYLTFCEKMRISRPLTKEQCGRVISSVFGESTKIRRSSDSKRNCLYKFASVDEAKKAFSSHFNTTSKEIFA